MPIPQESESAAEFLRYFSLTHSCLFSFHNDGTVYAQRVGNDDWKLTSRKKPDIPLVDWIAKKSLNSISAG